MTDIQKLLDIMAALRDPQAGCPWDKQQNFASIAPYTIEEAYEVADAIERADYSDLKDELGDLLLQVVYHSQMAQEQNLFDFNAVVQVISDKMIRRHPHVFGEKANSEIDTGSVKTTWEQKKAEERSRKGEVGVLAGIALALPALRRAEKLQKRAAKVNFDWPNIEPVFEKVDEELLELKNAHEQSDEIAMFEELGDLLFTCVNIARHLKINPEDALRAANQKFQKRFEKIESQLKTTGKDISECTLAELDSLWQAAKK